MPLYLADYVGDGTRRDPWRPRGSAQPGWSAIKLGPGGPSAQALLWLPTADPTLGARLLADNKSEVLAQSSRTKIDSGLGVVSDAKATTPRELVESLLLHPPGQKWNPLRPSGGRYEAWLGGERWVDAPAGAPVVRALAGAVAVTRARLTRRHLLTALALGLAWAVVPRRAWAASYASDFAGSESPLSEGGVWSSGADNGDFSDLQKVSGRVRCVSVGSNSAARVMSPSISEDQFGQALFIKTTGGNTCAIGLRMQSGSDESCYLYNAYSTTVSFISEFTASFGETILVDFGAAFGASDVARFTAIGTTLQGYKNGSATINVTDATLAAGQPGIKMHVDGALAEAELDDFLAGDLGYLLAESADCLNAETSDRLITEEATAGVGPCATAAAGAFRTLMGVGQ